MLTLHYVAYAISWLTLALINTGLAQSKGRWGLPWFLFSLLLGPIVTLLLVALRDRDEMSALERDLLLRELKKHLVASGRLKSKLADE